MLKRGERIGLRTDLRNVRDRVLVALQDEDDDADDLERLAAFEEEIRGARDALDALLEALDEAEDLKANVQPRTPAVVTRRTS